MARLKHMPQWKQKVESSPGKEVWLGLYTYPVLQAADILLYKATEVPVGDDQVKHVNFARLLAHLFNERYGLTFPEPHELISSVARLKSLKKPEEKMSKSDVEDRSRIDLTDTPEIVTFKLKKAVTDFKSEITYDPENRPAVSNLVDLYGAVTGLTHAQVVRECAGLDTVQFKEKLIELTNNYFSPIRDRLLKISADETFLTDVLNEGELQAREIAEQNYQEVRAKVGFI